MLFFPVKNLNVYTLIYLKLGAYYLNVIKTGRWLSARSVNYDLKQGDTVEIPVTSGCN